MRLSWTLASLGPTKVADAGGLTDEEGTWDLSQRSKLKGHDCLLEGCVRLGEPWISVQSAKFGDAPVFRHGQALATGRT